MRLEQNLKQQPYREDWQRHYALQTEQIQKAIQLNSETSLDGAIKQIYSAKRIFFVRACEADCRLLSTLRTI